MNESADDQNDKNENTLITMRTIRMIRMIRKRREGRKLEEQRTEASRRGNSFKTMTIRKAMEAKNRGKERKEGENKKTVK